MTDRTDDDSAMTTHSEWGSGAPHLLVSRGGEDRSIYDLTADEVTMEQAVALLNERAEKMGAKAPRRRAAPKAPRCIPPWSSRPRIFPTCRTG